MGQLVTQGALLGRIQRVREVYVMLDRDLADLYGVPTKRLNEQVKRNNNRFPKDFMFQLTDEEFANLRSHNATSSWGGIRRPPFAFTEHGVLMLSSVLRSDRAVEINIQIMRVFLQMRQLLMNHKELLIKLEELELNQLGHSQDIQLIYTFIRDFKRQKKLDENQGNRQRIGYNR